MSGEPLALRPHHGMCLAYFQGYGYSGPFTANLADIKRLLEAGAAVRLTCGPDCICGPCPNLQEGTCRTAEKVNRYDRAVLAHCGLQEGQVLPYSAFAALVAERIFRTGRRETICGDCQWDHLCRPSAHAK